MDRSTQDAICEEPHQFTLTLPSPSPSSDEEEEECNQKIYAKQAGRDFCLSQNTSDMVEGLLSLGGNADASNSKFKK